MTLTTMRIPYMRRLSWVAAAALLPVLLIACGGGDAGLSRSEVEEIVRAELAEAQDPPAPEPGLTSTDVEEAFRTAMAEMPQPEAGLTEAEVERIVQSVIGGIPEPKAGITAAEAERIARVVVASIPSRSAPAEYTRFFVGEAISMYETQGLDATLAYYNRPESIDGQWYVFIADENKTIVAHAAVPDLVGKPRFGSDRSQLLPRGVCVSRHRHGERRLVRLHLCQSRLRRCGDQALLGDHPRRG